MCRLLGSLAELEGQVQSLAIALLQLQAMHQVQRIVRAAWLQLKGSPAVQAQKAGEFGFNCCSVC